MNRTQVKVMWVGVLVAVAALIVCPIKNHPDYSAYTGYGLVFKMANWQQVNLTLLLLEWAIIAAITYAAMKTAATRP